jgi:hypothetical protein
MDAERIAVFKMPETEGETPDWTPSGIFPPGWT